MMTREEWLRLNREREALIDLDILGALTPEELVRLEELHKLADERVEKVAPRPTGVLDDLEMFCRSRRKS